MEMQRQVLSTIQSPPAFLRELFLMRKRKNPSYSTRSFARDIGISQTLFSLVINGKRHLTTKQAAQISILLGLSKEKTDQFLKSTLLHLPSSSKAIKKLRIKENFTKNSLSKIFDLENFKAISEWYHIAILDLSTIRGFVSDPKWIARRLGITSIQANDAIERLISLAFLKRKNGKLEKTSERIHFTTQKAEVAARHFHQQMIDLGRKALDKTDIRSFKAREISGTTMAVRRDRIDEAKEKIREFQKELADLVSDGECDEVYQLNVQFFPLTQ